MKKLFLLLLIILSYPTYSSNLLGGEITCRNINGLMYETTLTIYRDTISGNLPIAYTIIYRDSVDTIIASHVIPISNGAKHWNGFTAYTYIDTITFPNAGSFKVSSWDCCRDSVDNIINSASAGMYLECMILADGINSSPKFLSEPITFAQLDVSFTNNITPYDVDRDSLSWELAIPEDLVSNGSGGFNIVSLPYTYPPSDTSLPFHLESIFGDISFKPNLTGNYQIAVKLIEWRNGVQIGFVKREIRLKVLPSTNSPVSADGTLKVLTNIMNSWQTTWMVVWNPSVPRPDIYLNIGQSFDFDFNLSDSDGSGYPWIYCYSGSLINSNAWVVGAGYNDYANSYYNWTPNSIADVSVQPSFVTFRSSENFSSSSPPYSEFYKDYTFRIFVTQNTTGLTENNNETKSVYLKSIDMLGRETDPNLPGFRIDLYSDGKTKKVFRGE
ncbi:MAG: hypothetical protein ACKOX3_05305 [Bacteroidota bacterium]